MGEQARVYFGVFDFEADPRSVTEILGIEPYQAWRKGESGPNDSTRTHDRWEFRGTQCAIAPFEDQLDELLDILEGRRDQVRRLVERFEAGICCTATYRDTVNPGFHLSEKAIGRMASLGLSCDLDLYVLGGADES